MVIKNYLFIVCMMLLSFPAMAQELSLSFFQGMGISNVERVSTFPSGPGARLAYSNPLSESSNILIGIEARSINWGNQVGLEVGYQRVQELQFVRWTAGYNASIHNGIVLFRPSPIYSLGLAVGGSLRYKTIRRSFFQLGINLRYNVAPGYKQYGIYRGLELPLVLTYGLRLGGLD